MAINLSNVNISLNEFHRLSHGEYNAGEVKLAGETKLAKMNNHVGSFFVNKEIISHEEVIAIKQALVKALRLNGVQEDALNKIRKDLGLAAADVADRDLRHRSIMPLTRQKIREILDQNATAINDFNAQNNGNVRIRTTNQIYGPGGMDETSAAKRDAVNAKLVEHDRQVNVNEDILHFQAIVSNSIDFLGDEAERDRVVAMARVQLAALLQSCGGHPSADEPAVVTFDLPHGRTTSIAAGMSQKALAERLEDVIIRLSRRSPSSEQSNAVKAYQALGDDLARTAFLADLANDPKGGEKARALAVRCLYSRGVTDYASLAIANRLDDPDALSFAAALLALPKNTTPEQIRQNPVFVAMAAKEPVKVPGGKKAYVPATSNAEYNEFVFMSLRSVPESLLPGHRNLAETTRAIVRERLGAVAMPDDTAVTAVVDDVRMAGIFLDDWGSRRNTVETIRESFMAAALKNGALRIVSDELTRAIHAAGGNPANVWSAALGLGKRNGDFIRTLAAAGTPEQAQLIVAEHRDEIERQARLYCKAAPLRLNLRENTIQALAAKLGAGPDTIRAIWNTQDTGIIRAISKAGNDLMDKILSGEVRAETDAEVEAAFASLVERRIAALAAALKQVDDLNPPLPLHVADNIKAKLCDLQKFDYVNVERIIREVANRADAARLEELLRGNADKVAIQNELRRLSTAINSLTHGMLAGMEDIGPDDWDGIMPIAGVLLVFGRPGLADRLDAFFLRPDVKAEIEENDLNNPATVAMNYFREISFRQEIFAGGPFEASRIRSLFAEPRERAAFKAAGGDVRATEAGYHMSEIPMLARIFSLVKAAKNLSDDEAMAETLNPASQSRLLFDYGGRFIESVEGFRRGFELMDKFRTWREAQQAAYAAGQRNTPTLLNSKTHILSSSVGLERFVMEEVAADPAHDLYEEDPEKLFGMENNKTMRIVGFATFDGSYGTLMGLSAGQREFMCDVLDVINGPLPLTQAEKEEKGERLAYEAVFIGRTLKHWDELENLREEGRFDRAHIVHILYGDLGLPDNAGNEQINATINEKLEMDDINVSLAINGLMNSSGETFEACRDAVEKGLQLPNAPYVANASPSIDKVSGAEGAREDMVTDLARADGSHRVSDGAPLLAGEDVRFVVNFPNNVTLAARNGMTNDEQVNRANNEIADMLELLCGKVHDKQLAAVYYALSQSAAMSLKGGGVFKPYGVSCTEHLALTYTISKNDETGAVTIVTSEPHGFKDKQERPLNFHWTTTVALDGTVTNTPMVIEQPQ